jgi:hypothetical protein
MRYKSHCAILALLFAAAAFADTPSAQMAEKECANQLDAVIKAMEAKESPPGVDHNVNDLTIRILRKIQTNEGSCAAFQAFKSQNDGSVDVKSDPQN